MTHEVLRSDDNNAKRIVKIIGGTVLIAALAATPLLDKHVPIQEPSQSQKANSSK